MQKKIHQVVHRKLGKEQAYQRLACYNELMSYLESIAKTGEIKSKAWKIF